MRKDRLTRQKLVLIIFGILPVVWIGILIGPYVKDGLPGIVYGFPAAILHPFKLTFCGNTAKSVFVCLLIYAAGVALYFATAKNYRRREEHRSAVVRLFQLND